MNIEVDWIASAIGGLLSGVLSSAIFLSILWFMKPSITISPQISYYQENGKQAFTLKVVNRSRLKAYDLIVILYLVDKYYVDGGENLRLNSIPLHMSRLAYLQGRNQGLKTNSSHAALFRTYEDLNALWSTDSQHLMVEVICRHALSGFSRVCTQTYFTKKERLIPGRFKFGDSTDVVG